jgi:hypothetical protein
MVFDVSEKDAAFLFKANQSRKNCLLLKMIAPLINPLALELDI